MELTILALVLLSAALHSVWNLILKKSGDKQVFIYIVTILNSIIYLPFFVYYAAGRSVPLVGWYLIVGSAFFLSAYMMLLGKTYDHTRRKQRKLYEFFIKIISKN